MSNQTFFLQNSVAELEGRVGAEIVNGSQDDNYLSVALGFNFRLYGSNYSTFYPGSNTYITASSGSSQYYGLSLNGGPPYPGIHLGSSDNSWQRVWSYFGPDESPDYWRIRYEGTASTGGTIDAPNIVYEATYFNPSLTGDNQYIEVVFGIHNRTHGVFGVTNGSNDYLDRGSINDYTSYVFESDLDGRNWRILEGYSIASGQLQANSSPVLADTGSTLAYTEGDGEKVIDTSLSISDDDDACIESASVTISSGFRASEDVLSFQDVNGITGVWNAYTGILTLTGTATKAQYEQALQSVTYTNTDTDNPDSSDRTITWVVNDGNSGSNAITSTITITPLNDEPLTVDKLLYLQEDQTYTFLESDFSFADVDSGDSFKAIRITGNTSSGQLRYDNACIDLGSTGYVVLASNINKLSYSPGANENGASYDSFTFKVLDQSDAESAAATTEINVDPVNDGPIIMNPPEARLGEVIEAGCDPSNGNFLSGISIASGQLSADNVDVQNGDALTWSIVGSNSDAYGQISIDSSTGEWAYIFDNTRLAVQSLLGGDVRTSSFVARVSDEGGLYVDQTIEVTIHGSDDIIRQFADHVIDLSSEGQANGGDRWVGAQALGAPDTTRYGDLDTAWAPYLRNASGGNHPDEFLAVGFRRPVKASGFVIHENYGNGFVRSVEAIDLNGNTHPLWQGQDNSANNLAGFSVVLDEPTDYVVKGLKIWVDIDHSSDWEEIDAVELIGWATQETYQPLAPTLDLVAGNDVINATKKAAGIILTGQAEANSTVEVHWGSFLHSASVGSNRKWSLSIESDQIPSDSISSSISLACIDSEGRRSSQYTRTVRISSAAPARPEIGLIAGDNRINAYEKSVGVALQGRAIGCTLVEINWDGRTFSTGVSPDGNWTILIGGNNGNGLIPNDSIRSILSVVGIDADGNRSDPSERQLVIDTSDPAPPTLNSVASDDIVNAAEKAQGIELSGQAESGTTVRLEWGARTYLALVDSNGHWSVDVSASAIPADNPRSVIKMRAIDVAGNQSLFARSTVSIDTETPDNPFISVLSNDDILNSAEVSQSLILAGTAERDSVIDVSLNGHSYSCSANGSGRWTLNVDAVTLSGIGENATISASAADAAGNRSGVATRAVVVDTVAPNAPIFNSIGQGGIINATLKSAGVLLNGAAEAGATIRLTWERLVKDVKVASNGAWSLLVPKSDVPRDGATSVVVTAVDQAGNTSQAVIKNAIVDTTLPQAPKLAGKISGDGVLTATERDGGLVVKGTGEAGSTVDITFAGLTRTAVVTSGGWQIRFNKMEIPVAVDQKQIVRLTARDAAGNVSDETQEEFVLRTAPPTVPLIDLIATDNIVNATEVQALTVQGTGDVGSEISLTFGSTTQKTKVDQSGSWKMALKSSQMPITDGIYQFQAVAANGSGLTSVAAIRSVMIDRSAPSLLSATVEGTSIILDCSEEIRASSVSPSQFSVNLGRNSLPVQSIAVDPTRPSRLVLQLVHRIEPGAVVSIDYQPNRQSGQVNDLAGNPLAQISGMVPTSFRSALDVAALANGYRFLQLTGSGSVRAVGNSADNAIVGNIGDNVITGGLGADELTGLDGRDCFVLTALGDSLLGQGVQRRFDRITDFAIGTDVIDGPSAVPRGQVSVLSSVMALDSTNVGARLTSALFKANSAVAFSLSSNVPQRWFIALNDSIAGFDPARDALVEITGFTGQISNMQIV